MGKLFVFYSFLFLMPGNKPEEGICNLYELDNSSQSRHLSQVVGGNWPVLDYGQWFGKPTQIEASQNFNLQNYNLQQLGINGICYLCYYLSRLS